MVTTLSLKLREVAREQIREADFNELALMIREAILEEFSRVTDMLKDVIRKLRSEADKAEHGL